MTDSKIAFNRVEYDGREFEYLREAIERGNLAGGGAFTDRCHRWLREYSGAAKVLLTHSCTAALEMAAILSDVRAGDEVIMPSFTFVSTANAFVLRGAVPVFVDVREETLNIDERLLQRALTSRTRAVVPVHYAGVGCDMTAVTAFARTNDLMIIEDAAQGLMADYNGRPLGSIGQLGAVSFHQTKNISSGEGGALFINEPALIQRAEIIWEKGTNRSQFQRGEIDKYTWLDVGSSFLPGETTAAVLLAQLERATEITARRLAIWNSYHDGFMQLERTGVLRRPVLPGGTRHNGHIYYLLLDTAARCDRLRAFLSEQGIASTFHYVPLHSSPAGRRFGRAAGALPVTEDLSYRLLRLPLHPGLTMADTARIIDCVARGIQR